MNIASKFIETHKVNKFNFTYAYIYALIASKLSICVQAIGFANSYNYRVIDQEFIAIWSLVNG